VEYKAMLCLASFRQLHWFCRSSDWYGDFSLVLVLICGHHRCCVGTLVS